MPEQWAGCGPPRRQPPTDTDDPARNAHCRAIRRVLPDAESGATFGCEFVSRKGSELACSWSDLLLPILEKKPPLFLKWCGFLVAGQAGFEPTTFGFGDRRSTPELLTRVPCNIQYGVAGCQRDAP